MRLPFLVISLLIFACSIVDGASFSVTLVDTIRYESSLASEAISPRVLFQIPFGTNDESVGGTDQDKNHQTEGVPAAFLPVKDGTVWILDSVNRKLKHFSLPGKLLGQIDLSPLVPPEDPPIRHFAPAPKDGFYLVSPAEGKVLRIDQSGKRVNEIEGLSDTWSVSVDASGNSLIENPGMDSILRFDSDGVLIERYDGFNGLSPFTDIDGHLYGLRGNDRLPANTEVSSQTITPPSDMSALLYRVLSASPSQTVDLATFSLDLPADRGAHYVSHKVLGVDAAWNVYLELVACDDTGNIHRNRIVKCSPTGHIVKYWEIISTSYFSPDLARHLEVTRDGRLMGFRVEGKTYQLVHYLLK